MSAIEVKIECGCVAHFDYADRDFWILRGVRTCERHPKLRTRPGIGKLGGHVKDICGEIAVYENHLRRQEAEETVGTGEASWRK
jgi:hypothetical protein